ncbi:armadillo-type protein [Collybia nuda]|uniref:Armadillo-type protein n=1 Tax=Collybia nuda TaxID=64659 RepID=A0A9P5YJ44_9AGAR|nr:armadillo-type protein [Collybia nuda]
MTSMPQSQDVFNRLKVVCVPLLEISLLSPTNTPNAHKFLSQILKILRDVKASGFILTTSLISYTFFPLSTILRRNSSLDIPDQVFEQIFLILGLLCEDWWWNCDIAVWEQIFMLCGAVIGGIDRKGKEKVRDDETKTAAAKCLLSLLHARTSVEEPGRFPPTPNASQKRLDELKIHTHTDKFLPVLGQTLNSLLNTVESPSLGLQRVSLELLALFIGTYAPDDLVPSVLPGIISSMSRVALGKSQSKGWANGEIVSGALNTMLLAVIRAVGDDICIQEGAINNIMDLEDLAEPVSKLPQPTSEGRRHYSTSRTSSWLHGTSSQLLIAMNTLTPLVSHPNISALLALSKFSSVVLGATSLTLPRAQPLLVSFLLSLSISSYPAVSDEARGSLTELLTTPSVARHSLLQTLLYNTSKNLLALPRLLPTRADTKIEHIAGLIEAACQLASTDGLHKRGLSSISAGISKMLGPAGGIEKWGWNLLLVLEFVEPPVTLFQASMAQFMLESDTRTPLGAVFPEVIFKNVLSSSTRVSLERMFRALGRAGGDGCLFSVEWFANVGRQSSGHRSVAATWCACRLLEGVAGMSLIEGYTGDPVSRQGSKRLLKLARAISRSTAEIWDQVGPDPLAASTSEEPPSDVESNLLVQHIHGLSSIHETLRIIPVSRWKENTYIEQPTLHKALQLQLLAVCAGILQARFTSMLIYTLYPVLHSLVSPVAYLSSTALATLHFFTTSMSYASPANLLLSNFDYALDAVSRRLSRRWLDIDATKALALMVRLVGSDIVERASDVVEECFDRLDEFHGYGVIVEGLVEVLGEVINVIKADVGAVPNDAQGTESASSVKNDHQSMHEFLQWVSHRNDSHITESYTTEYGPAPHKSWGPEKTSDEVDTVNGDVQQGPDPFADPPPTPIQVLTKQMVSRSLYFLTHGSPIIRSRIVALLDSSVSVLPPSALLPSVHSAWPFILNRLADSEPFVVSAAASLVEGLVTYHGSFMFRRIWDDVWPKFSVLLQNLNAADSVNALSRRGPGAVGTESAYTHSHRLYRSVINSMTAAVKGVAPHDALIWEVLLAFRRFLHTGAHEELQHSARGLYEAIGVNNSDAVWLVLSSTSGDVHPVLSFLRVPQWKIEANTSMIFQNLIKR